MKLRARRVPARTLKVCFDCLPCRLIFCTNNSKGVQAGLEIRRRGKLHQGSLPFCTSITPYEQSTKTLHVSGTTVMLANNTATNCGGYRIHPDDSTKKLALSQKNVVIAFAFSGRIILPGRLFVTSGRFSTMTMMRRTLL